MEKHLDKFQQRKKRIEAAVLFGGVLLIGALLLFVFFEQAVVALPLGIAGALFMFFGYAAFTQLEEDFKGRFLKRTLKEWIDNCHYDHKNGLSMKQAYESEFLKQADRFKSEDFLSGSIDGVAFISSDLELKERRVHYGRHGTRTHYHTFFRGRLFIFDFNKRFDGVLQVLEDTAPTTRRPYKKVKMESIRFNEKFRTFTTNPHTAYYILTPHFMEALMRLERNHPGLLSIAFIDSKLYFGINNFKDTFSLKLFAPLNKALIETFKRDVDIIREIVDELKLNRKIFKN